MEIEVKKKHVSSFKKTCKKCGKDFIAFHVKTVLCDKCKQEFDEAHRLKPMTKKCALCGKEFTTIRKQVRYCSDACRKKKNRMDYDARQKAERAERRAKLAASIGKTATCPICGNDFVKKIARQKYCSTKCSDVVKFEKLQEQRKSTRQTSTCPVCGKKFVPNSESQVCCSRSCGVKFRAVKAQSASAGKTNLNKGIEELDKEAKQCGLSYGKYIAMLSIGKTFAEMRLEYLRWSQGAE